MTYARIKTRVLTPEYLIAILSRAGRKKDIDKIRRLLDQAEVSRKRLMNIHQRFGLKKRFESIMGKN